MKKYILILLLISTISIFAEKLEVTKNTDISIVEYSADRLSEIFIDFNLLEYEQQELFFDNSKYQQLKIPDEGSLMEVGKPDLPTITRLFVIPDEGGVEIELTSLQDHIRSDILIYPSQPLSTESDRESFPFNIDEEFYIRGGVYPTTLVKAGEPVIFRDHRIVPVTFNPFQYDPVTRELRVIENVRLTLRTSGNRGVNSKTGFRKKSHSFEKMYRSVITNYDMIETRNDEYQVPSYLFIYPEDQQVETYLQNLIDWKHQKGFEVTAVSTAIAGTNQIDIANYIQDAYDNWENPPEFICLVGDAGGAYSIPTGHFLSPPYGGEGDQIYGLLEGNDILADVIIGRLSFNTTMEFLTILSKILSYEKTPYMGNEDWYNNALMVADPLDSGQSCVDTKMYIADMIEEFTPDIECAEVYSGNWVIHINNSFDEGISYFNYRGFAGMSGWTVNHVYNLNNGYMMPLAISLTCLTGDFEGTTDCMSEAFLKAGSPTVPAGGIAAVSTATGNTHTCFNNCVDAGIFSSIFVDGIFNPGSALLMGKLNLYMTYPDNPNESVDKFSYWNNLMGDPGLELWSAVPEELVLEYDPEIPAGSNYMEIFVTDLEGEPVEGVWVTVLKGEDEIFISDRSDAFGSVILPIAAENTGTATITATKHNYIPEINEFEIVQVGDFLHIGMVNIDDDNQGESSGNDDGLINAGEVIELTVELVNSGSNSLVSVTADISTSSEYVILLEDHGEFGDIEPGGTYSATYLLEADLFSSGDLEIELQCVISDDSGNTWNDLICLVTSGPYLEINDYVIDDGEDNILDPGETADIQLLIQNIGSVDITDIQVELSCENNGITINENTGFLGDIAAGEEISSITDLFNISTDVSLVPGSLISFQLNFYNSQGYQQNNSFSVQVGQVEVHDPLGPDNFGHYIYDNGDLQYINSEPYNWIEIDPNYGGSGTIINNLIDPGNMGASAEVELPFEMTFYGREYNRITICSNGWFAPGAANMNSFMNWGLPAPLGPSPMIAVFWDDLKLGDAVGNNYIPNGGNICYYNMEAEDKFIIEWSRLRNEFDDQLETFQAIIYDPYVYPTSNGDCQILLQYYEVSNTDQGSYETLVVNHGQYATVGIEDHSSTDGLQYTYNNDYPEAALELSSMTALMISGAPISTEDPYLVFSGYELNDEGGNGQLDYSEQADLAIMINNLGGSIATSVTAEITTEDEYVTIQSGFSNYNDIEAGETVPPIDDFSIQVADICPDGHQVNFMLLINSDQGTVELPFNLVVNAPSIILEEIIVSDSNNGILDPGETAPVLFRFRNSGGSDSELMNLVINFTSETVSSDSYAMDLGTIEANTMQEAAFEFAADPTTEIGTEIVISWQVTDDLGYVFSGEWSFFIAQIPVLVIENFDAFPPEGWSLEGGFNWLGSFSNGSGGTPPEAIFWGGIPSQDSQKMISVPVNTLGSNQLILEFRHSVVPLGEDFSVGVATSDDGVIWNTVVDYGSEFIPPGIEQLTIETPDVGSLEFRIAFFFEGDTQFINYWAVDEVVLYHVPIVPQSFLIGTVELSSGTGNPAETMISAGAFSTSPDEEGNFVLQVEPGTYDVTAYLPGYLPEIYEDYEVPDPWINHYLDFVLDEVTSDYPPVNLELELEIHHVHLQWDPPGSGLRSNEFPTLTREKSKDRERMLNGYRIYRNGNILSDIGDIAITEYHDMSLDNGEYEYYVTALFDDAESEPSNTVTAIVVLPPPQELVVTATPSGGNVILNWQSPNDYVNGFRIYRNEEFIVETLSSYYFDAGVDPGNYIYEVTALYGEYESDPATGEIEVTSADNDLLPDVTALLDNYPNPFNPETVINYQLAEAGVMNLQIYNIKGQSIRTLINKKLEPGRYNTIWDGKDDKGGDVSSGIYYYRMKSGNYSSCRKMILMK